MADPQAAAQKQLSRMLVRNAAQNLEVAGMPMTFTSSTGDVNLTSTATYSSALGLR